MFWVDLREALGAWAPILVMLALLAVGIWVSSYH